MLFWLLEMPSGHRLAHHFSHWECEPQAKAWTTRLWFLGAEEHVEELSTVMPGWIVGLDDGLNQVNHGLWFLGVQRDMIFPV
jgi:hypothetical protein